MDDCYVSTYTQYGPELGRTSRDKRRGGGGIVFECWWDLLLCLVVTGKAMDTGLDQDQTELGVLVFPVDLEVLANSNSLLHEVPKVFRNGRSESYIRISGCRLSFQRHQPFDLRIRRILFPVTNRTWGMPCESRRVTPIWDGVKPLRACLQMCSTTSSGVVLSHEGGARRYGSAEDAIEVGEHATTQ